MPILKREFYFLRHAQTTYTAEQLATDADVSINENGHQQAHHIVDVISQLPIKTVGAVPDNTKKCYVGWYEKESIK